MGQYFQNIDTDMTYLPADHRINYYEFLCDLNQWSAGTNQKQLRKILKTVGTTRAKKYSMASLTSSTKIVVHVEFLLS